MLLDRAGPYNDAAMQAPRPRASLLTIGCRLNQAETALLTARLKQDGYDVVEYGQATDLLVLNTCSVTENAEKDCRYIVRRTLRHSPHAFVAVTGCYAQTGAEALRKTPGIDLIVGGQYKLSLPDFLPNRSALKKHPSPQVLHTRTISRDDFVLPGVADYQSTRANLKVQDGCDFMCSFCLIPFARGRERSRTTDDILREAEALGARGHRELVLTGVNLGRYNHGGRTLLDLIQRLETIPTIDRIRISSIEPTTIPDGLLEHMAGSRKLCRFLHIPLQSGDDRVLRMMNRRYTVNEYVSFIEKAVACIPDLGLGTDLMVGFPGEGEREFANTLSAASNLPLAYFHVFSYSERPGTAAVRMSDRVPRSRIHARSRTLSELSRTKRLAFYQAHIGRTVRVLFEERSEGGPYTGLTGNYIRTAVTASEDLTNHLRDVVITGTMDGLAVGSLAKTEAQAISTVAI